MDFIDFYYLNVIKHIPILKLFKGLIMKNVWCLLTGVYTTLAFYHLMIYLGRKKDKNKLYYSFLVITFAFVLAAKNFSIYSQKIGMHLDLEFTLRLIANSLCILAISLFLYKSLNIKNHKNTIIISYILFIVSPSISGIIIAINIKNYILANQIFVIPAILYGLIYWIYISKEIICKSYYKDPDKLYIIIGVFIHYICYTSYPLLSLLGINVLIQLLVANTGFLIFAVMSAYSLASNLSSDYKDLMILKHTLEDKVKERTLELENANNEINKINKQTRSFFVAVIHEIKNPITILKNCFKKIVNNTNSNIEFDIIKSNLNKLEGFVMDYLDIEMIERGKSLFNYNNVNINLSKTVKEKIQQYIKNTNSKNISINCNIKDKLFINIDPYAIDRVLNNLFDNAVKFTGQGGLVNIYLNCDDSHVILKVEDNGIGIPPDKIEDIFKPFYQINNKKYKLMGIGLGLSIVKQIINEVNGTIDVKSELDRGTSFVIKFKRSFSEKYNENVIIDSPNINHIEFKKETVDPKKPTILIVEDNKDLLYYLQLEFYDIFNVFMAEDGNKGLEKIHSMPVKPDLIISDIMMNEMDGYEFRNELLKDEGLRAIPFIFLTAKNSDMERMKGYTKNVVDYITKPFDVKELYGKISSIIDLKRLITEENIKEFENHISSILRNKNINEKASDTFDNKCYGLALSKREKEITRLIIEGKENKEIAGILNLRTGTIKGYTNKIYKKCNVGNRIELLNHFK